MKNSNVLIKKKNPEKYICLALNNIFIQTLWLGRHMSVFGLSILVFFTAQMSLSFCGFNRKMLLIN